MFRCTLGLLVAANAPILLWLVVDMTMFFALCFLVPPGTTWTMAFAFLQSAFLQPAYPEDEEDDGGRDQLDGKGAQVRPRCCWGAATQN